VIASSAFSREPKVLSPPSTAANISVMLLTAAACEASESVTLAFTTAWSDMMVLTFASHEAAAVEMAESTPGSPSALMLYTAQHRPLLTDSRLRLGVEGSGNGGGGLSALPAT